MTGSGHLYGVGVGPGDPDLLTVKAARLVAEVPVVAYFAARGRSSRARRVVADLLRPDQREIRIDYPVTTEETGPDHPYEVQLGECYDAAASALAEVLAAGTDVAVLCEGDPLFFGSYMYVHNRLADRFSATVVPGISSPAAGAAALSMPLVCGNEVFSVVSGVMSSEDLKVALANCDAAVVIKLGRNLAKVRAVVESLDLLDRAYYVSRATEPEQATCRLADADPATAPYFSMVVIASATAARR